MHPYPQPPHLTRPGKGLLGAGWLIPLFHLELGRHDQPLTNLTRKGALDLVRWLEQRQPVFVQVKKALCGEPLRHMPIFSLSFILKTDASKRAEGLVPSGGVN